MNNTTTSILLVEGESDKLFFDCLLKYLNKESSATKVDAISFQKIEGSDEKKITAAFKSNRTDLRTNQITHLGIVLDIDDYSKAERILQINNAIKLSLSEYNVPEFTEDIKTVNFDINGKRKISFSYFLIADNSGKGNLESLLQNIVITEPTAANCLNEWLTCTKKNGINIKESDFLKFWRDVYVRYDYCADKQLSKHASENCTFEKSLVNMLIDEKAKAWNFEAETLKELRTYLSQFI